MRSVTMRAACIAVLAGLGVTACGAAPRTAVSVAPSSGAGAGAGAAATAIPSSLLSQARPIGAAPRFHPPAAGPVIGQCTPALGRRDGVHVEVFASDKVLLLPAGTAADPPRRPGYQRPLLRRPGDPRPDRPRARPPWRQPHAWNLVPFVGAAALAKPADLVQCPCRDQGRRVCQRQALVRRAIVGTAHPPRGDRS